MNSDYIYCGGKATILEDNGNQKEVDYYDNLSEVLERENLIEILERKSINLNEDIDYINHQYKKSRKEYIDSLLWILFPLIIYGIGLIFTHFFGNNHINTSIGTFDYGVLETIFTALFTTPIGVILAKSNYKYRKTLQEKLQLKEEEVKKLERQISLQKEKIEELKKDKTNTIEDNYFTASLSKVPSVDTIRNMNLERLLSYLNQDLIIQDESQELEEKGPVLKKTLK